MVAEFAFSGGRWKTSGAHRGPVSIKAALGRDPMFCPSIGHRATDVEFKPTAYQRRHVKSMAASGSRPEPGRAHRKLNPSPSPANWRPAQCWPQRRQNPAKMWKVVYLDWRPSADGR